MPFLRFTKYRIYHLETRTVPFLLNALLLLFFSCLIALAKISSIILNKNGENGKPIL